MKKRTFLTCLLLLFVAEATALAIFAFWETDGAQDTVLVNEAVRSVQEDWDVIEEHKNQTSLDYVVLDLEGNVCYRTDQGLSESISMAVKHRDTILDLWSGSSLVGKIIISNDSAQLFREKKHTVIMLLSFAVLLQFVICAGFLVYLNHVMIRPFQKLKGFAERIAGGCLDIPLEMDRYNLFGVFTESFDIMRSELKRAQKAEAEASAGKRELVAKLSHDIKTPVASIKAASELGAALTDDEKIRDNYIQIIRKADQIDALISELFTAALEDLKQLSVAPRELESSELAEMLENADYLHWSAIPQIPGCILCADRRRLQQVLDNLFANAYKYAAPPAFVSFGRQCGCLSVCIEDSGGGVSAEELPFLKEKFRRGSNAEDKEGAGLGLYLSDYFMKEMRGGLVLENGVNGLRAVVEVPLSGKI